MFRHSHAIPHLVAVGLPLDDFSEPPFFAYL
jgi:hypothetical protein